MARSMPERKINSFASNSRFLRGPFDNLLAFSKYGFDMGFELVQFLADGALKLGIAGLSQLSVICERIPDLRPVHFTTNVRQLSGSDV